MIENIKNKVGSLSVLRKELDKHGIFRFHTFNEIEDFKNNFNIEIEQCIEKEKLSLKKEIEEYEYELNGHKNEYKRLIEEEKIKLTNQIKKNEEFINRPIKFKLFHPLYILKKNMYINKNKYLSNNFEEESEKPLNNKKNRISILEDLINNYSTNFDKEVEKRSKGKISKIHYTIETLNKLDTIYYGAIGELKAVKELSKLPETYYIINDYQLHFNTPIYDKRNNDRIYSIQVDHIVVGPTGLFLIETKNWNQNSINNLDLFSPVKQIRRSSFALFVYLNNLVSKNKLISFRLDWGAKKISLNSILLMTNATTTENFQFVKIASLDTINKIIKSHSIELNHSQVQELVELLAK